MKKYVISIVSTVLCMLSVYADNITVVDVSVSPGETQSVSINLTNTETNLVSFQMDLTLPEGVSINKAGCSLSSRFTDEDQELTIGRQSNGSFRLTSTSLNLTPISGTSGEIITLSLSASETATGGTATLSNIRFVTSNSERVTIDNASFNISIGVSSPAITFTDANVKALCVANWDTNGDGELSEVEAAAVTDLGEVFKGNTTITSFNELQYFTGLTTIGNNAFDGCTGLTSIAIPTSLKSVKKDSFKNCTSLSKVIVSDIAAWCGIIYEELDAWASLGSFPLGYAQHLYSDEDTEITEVVIPEGVTRIEPLAFRDAKYVTSVTIPNSVTSIGAQAFRGMHRLTSITIPQNVTNIESFTFSDCQSLTSFTIPEGVVNMEGNVFRDCTSLTSVSLPESLTALGGHVFIGCTNLASITIPDGITHLSRIAFENCPSLTTFIYNKAENSLTKVDGIYQIGTAEDLCNFAILSTAANTDICAQLTADIDYTGYTFPGYTLDEHFQHIGLNGYCGTFDGNGHTITVNINNSDSWEIAALFRILGNGGVIKNLRVAGHVESVAKFSAGIVSDLKSGKISHCVSDVDIVSNITGDCTDGGIAGIATYDGQESIVEYCVVAGSFQGSNAHHRGGIIGIGRNGISDNITIDNCLFIANVDGLDVTESGTFIRQPTDKTTINNCYYLNVLGTVTSGTQTTTVQITGGELCFLLNGNQININWTQNLTGTDIDAYPLPFSTHAQVYANDNLYSNVAPNIAFADANVKALCVANWDTNGDGELNVAEAAAVTDLGNVFRDNTTITSFNELQYFTGLTAIGDLAFAGCSGLTSVTIPYSATTTGEWTFFNCSSLTSVILPEGLTEIARSAFRGSGLESITFPTTLTEVGLEAFWGAPLRSVDFNGSAVTIDGGAFLGTALETLTIPSNVTLRGWSNFYGCSSLQTVTIESVEYSTIVDMFYGCTSLRTAVLPSTKIMSGAFFGGCTSLESVTFLSVDDNFAPGAQNYARIFRDLPPTQVVFNVPEGTAESLLQGGYMYLSDLSGLPFVRSEFEAEATRIQAMADALTDGDKTALATAISEARTAVNAAEDYATVYAQIAAIKDAAKIYLTTARLTAGFDVTAAFVTNPNFDRFQIGWNVCGGDDHRGWQGKDYNHYENGDVVVDNFIQAWRSGAVLDNGQFSQNITNLPAGTYRLECDAIATCGYDASVEVTGVNLFAGAETTALSTENKKPLHFSVEFAQTETGNCTIGIDINNTSANWVVMDNVRLYRLDVEERNYLSMADAEGIVGGTVTMPVCLTNEDEITAFQVEIETPEGISVSSCSLTERKIDHTPPTPAQLNNGNYQIATLSPTSSPFSGNEGALLNVTLTLSSDLQVGDYPITIKNIELTTPSEVGFTPSNVTATLTVRLPGSGDVNGDGKVTITDAVGIVNYILGRPSANFRSEVADVNGDGRISITDAVAVVNRILTQGASSNVKEWIPDELQEIIPE